MSCDSSQYKSSRGRSHQVSQTDRTNLSSAAIMAPKWANKKGQNKDGKKGYGGDKKSGMSMVPTFRALCKEKLAPYPASRDVPSLLHRRGQR